MNNPMPTLKHLDIALKSIKAAKTDDQARDVLDTIVEMRDWKRNHEDSNS